MDPAARHVRGCRTRLPVPARTEDPAGHRRGEGQAAAASEIGKACGESPVLITTFKQVKPGTPGAISIEGTVAGLATASALASLAVLLGLVDWPTTLAIVGGATTGAVAESALGATLEPSGILNNDLLNFINTAVAAAVALVLAST